MRRVVVLVALAASTFAASVERRLGFEAPFAFRVGKQVLPAGMYEIRRSTVDGLGLVFENVRTHKAVFVSLPNQRRHGIGERETVEFHCEGMECRVAAVTHVLPGVRFESWQKVRRATLVALLLNQLGD